MKTDTLYYDTLPSPLGLLCLVADDEGLREICFPAEHRPNASDHWQRDPRRLAPARQQLTDYFAGTRREFTVPLHPHGTAFQLAVWQELSRIPFGITISSFGVIVSRSMPKTARTSGDSLSVFALRSKMSPPLESAARS